MMTSFKSLVLAFSIGVGFLAFAQEKPAAKECTWVMRQSGVAGDPVRVSPNVFNVFLTDTPSGVNPNPEFKGLVVLKVVSSEEGRILDACAVRTPDESLVQPAIETVMKWQARPYFLNRKPVKIESVVGLVFEKKAIKFEPLQSVPTTH